MEWTWRQGLVAVVVGVVMEIMVIVKHFPHGGHSMPLSEKY